MLLHVLLCVATCLPLSVRTLVIFPTTLIVDLLEKALVAAEKSIVAVGASRGDPNTPIIEGRSVRHLPLSGRRRPGKARGAGALEELAGAVEEAVEAVEGVGVAVGVVAGVEVSVAAVEAAAAVAVGAEVAEVAAMEEEVAKEVELVGVALRRGSGSGGGQRQQQQQQQRTRDIPPPSGASAGVDVFDLDFDAILAAMYAVTIRDEGDCYRCFPPDPGIETAALDTGEAAALGASEAASLGARASAPSGAGESALTGPGPTYVPCVEGRQRAAPHSSQFPPTEAPLQTLHMDVCR
ncbi:unnamed protein product [Closterium sp. NIES-64]|nr:unnamed protein product [Closterium sp. NIES-64]